MSTAEPFFVSVILMSTISIVGGLGRHPLGCYQPFGCYKFAANIFQSLIFGWKIAKGVEIGAGEIAMGEMRLEVIVDGGMQRRGVAVPRQASISDVGEGTVLMASGGLLSLFKVCICVSDSGRVDVWGRL